MFRHEILRSVARIFSIVEGFSFGNGAAKFPPLFIVGLPRAGTTLLYQTLCHCHEVAFPPTLTNYLPFAPALSAWVCKLARKHHSSDFQSHYGKVRGLASPGESTMWNLWFEKDVCYGSTSELETRDLRELERMVGRIERINNAPFVAKNLRNNNRVRVLAELFPAAVFLVVLRNPRSTALSLCRARTNSGENAETWFSVKPSNYAEIRTMPFQRSVVLQIQGILDDLRVDMTAIGPERFIIVDYEGFCSSPARYIEELQRFLARRGIHLIQRQSPPERFQEAPGEVDVPQELEESLQEHFPQNRCPSFPCYTIGKELP